MGPPSSFIISFILAIIVVWFKNTAAETPALTKLESERKALVQSGWWPRYTSSSSSPCELPGIICNEYGHVTVIYHQDYEIGDKFGAMDYCKLPGLTRLSLSRNLLSVSIPACLGNLSELRTLDLSMNSLNGSIPSQICALSKLRTLFLFQNLLSGSIPTCFENLSKLQTLDLSIMNNLSGSIPSQICALSELTTLFLSRNLLSRSIPTCFGNLSKLETLDLSMNNLSGSIPSQICALSKLTTISLFENLLSGSIPTCFGNLSKLETLYLSMNKLNGSIPSQLGSLKDISYLYLDRNELTGSIPSSIGKMTNLQEMNLQENKIDDSIPPQVGNMYFLRYMNISFNKLSGVIPLGFGRLKKLQSLDLRNNFLFGSIPDFLNDFENFFLSLNLSYNSLSGQIPDSLLSYNDSGAFLGNKDLVCTTSSSKTSHKIFGQKKEKLNTIHKILHHKEIIIFIACCIFSITLTLGIWLYYRERVKPYVLDEKIMESRDVISIWNYDGRIAYEELVKVIEDFDLKYCIGTGGYGSVYRAELPNGKVFAVKKLHRLEAEEPAFDKSFRNEAKLLIEVRHRNIIKLYGFCLHRRSMFLVYEYMERGSLFYALRTDVEALELNWSRRLSIVKDIAHAMSYLHHNCSQSIIHRDLSTNNILLNEEMQAFVSDFGTARSVDPTLTNISTIAGTFGYIAPELAYTLILNEKCDVYSYGVIAMETIMGKHPQEIISKLSTSSIEQVKLQEILDHWLPCPRNGSLITTIL